MNLIFRLLAVCMAGFFRRPLGILDESRVRLRVWPNDLDLNGHMNNGRYLSLMDLGRLDWLARTGLLKIILARKWTPLVGAATIQFRKSLLPFRLFELKTRAVCWNEKWFFFEQEFDVQGEMAARAFVKALLRDSAGNIPPARVLETVTTTPAAPAMPKDLQLWLDSENPA